MSCNLGSLYLKDSILSVWTSLKENPKFFGFMLRLNCADLLPSKHFFREVCFLVKLTDALCSPLHLLICVALEMVDQRKVPRELPSKSLASYHTLRLFAIRYLEQCCLIAHGDVVLFGDPNLTNCYRSSDMVKS